MLIAAPTSLRLVRMTRDVQAVRYRKFIVPMNSELASLLTIFITLCFMLIFVKFHYNKSQGWFSVNHM